MGVARVLKYEGHMLVYDLQTNGVGWITMRGVPLSLMVVELQSAGDLEELLPLPFCGVSGPKALTTSSHRTGHRILTG